LAYSWPEKQKTGNHPSDAITASKTPDFVDSERPLSGDRPSFKCLAHWWWGGDPDSGDHSLYDKEGLTLARLVRGPDGFYHLRSPLTWPRMSWGELEQAKHHAESLALASLPLDRKLAARIKRDNETPHSDGATQSLMAGQCRSRRLPDRREQDAGRSRTDPRIPAASAGGATEGRRMTRITGPRLARWRRDPLAFVSEALRDPGLDPDAAWIAPPVTRAADGTLFAGQRGAIAPQSERSQLATVCAHPAAVVRAGMRPL